MKITAIYVTPLDAYHSLAKVHWEGYYKNKDGIAITAGFAVFYFLQAIGGSLKIFAYITGDEQKFFEEKGLLPV